MTTTLIRTKILAAGAAIVTLLALATFMFETQYSTARADVASTSPTISNIVASTTNTGATITWTTNQAATGQVVYGTTSSYNASSTLDSTLGTSHISFLGGLTPNTLYHFQVQSVNASSSMGTSSDQMFTTTNVATSTPTTTPTISTIVATSTQTSATITWTTDILSDTRVAYGTTSSYGNFTTLDSSQVTSHSATILGLTPNTVYHFQVRSASSTGPTFSPDKMFTTLMSVSTSTGTTTDTDSIFLQNEIDSLQNQLNSLLSQLNNLQSLINSLIGGGFGTTTPPGGGGGSAMVDQDGAHVRAGTNIDFGGHNFGPEEHVNVTLNGSVVGHAFSNLSGGFSTGSISVPSTPGMYTYTLLGLTSGKTAVAHVTVIP